MNVSRGVIPSIGMQVDRVINGKVLKVDMNEVNVNTN